MSARRSTRTQTSFQPLSNSLPFLPLVNRFRKASRITLAAGFALVVPAAILTPLLPQATAQAQVEQTAPEVPNSKLSAIGTINSQAVYVRSGPSENYYATMKLDKGTKVTVVGIKGEWLKILPPEGSFCYISQAYVEKHGDGSVGRVTKDGVIVRAGSVLTAVKTPITQLNAGAEVEITGQQDEYLKIKPPEHTFFYVNQQFITPDHTIQPQLQNPVAAGEGGIQVGDPAPAPGAGESQPQTPTAEAGHDATPTTTPSDQTIAGNVQIGAATQPTTQPEPGIAGALSGSPTTMPAEDAASVQALFDKSEADFKDASEKPLEQQPIAELIKSYQKLASSKTLGDAPRRLAEARLKLLQIRQAAADQYASVRKTQADLKSRQQALEAEQQELQARLAASGITYTAVGTLRTSSLQVGGQTLYRLTDPANGHTVCYIRTADPKFTSMLDQFVGVRGQVADDSQLNLRVLTPVDVTPIDPARVNNGISAGIVPPSLMAKSPEASADQQ